MGGPWRRTLVKDNDVAQGVSRRVSCKGQLPGWGIDSSSSSCCFPPVMRRDLPLTPLEDRRRRAFTVFVAKIRAGHRRAAISAQSSWAICTPDSDVSATSARHSCVKLSTIASTRNRRPTLNACDIAGGSVGSLATSILMPFAAECIVVWAKVAKADTILAVHKSGCF